MENENPNISLTVSENSNSANTPTFEYPEKPLEETKKQSISKSIASMALYIGAAYLIFKWDLTYISVLAGIVLIHELGHYLAMRYYKYSDLSIFFIPLVGAFASGSKDTLSQKQSIIIVLAGPLPGIILGTILYYFGLSENNHLLLTAANIFIFLNLFNLLPIMPLDGGRVIKSLFFENNEIVNTVFIILSIVALGSYSLYSESYTLLVIPFFLILQLNTQSQLKKVKKSLLSKEININKTYNELTNEEYWLIRDEIGKHMKYYNRFITPKKYVPSVKEQDIIQQVKALVYPKPVQDLKIMGKIITTVIWIVSFILPFVAIFFYYRILGMIIL